ncbi:MAG: PilZ domain-containing protein [Hellea sp.]|nr:PilZ domain-containing protein [Hellea sp.]
MLQHEQNAEQERRDHLRAKSFKHAKIYINDDKSIYDAVLKNVSAYGAALSLGMTQRLPESFRLLIVSDDVTVPCHVEWRRADMVGVSF